MNYEVTTAQFAEMTGVEYASAQGMLKYLCEKGLAKKIGSVPAKGGKGKPSTLYSVPQRVELEFGAPVTADAAVA